MNSLESYIIEDPFGNSDTCAKFTIDDISEQFTLSNIANVGQLYTLGFWVKGEAESYIYACNGQVPVTTEWERYVVNFTATQTNLNIVFGSVGTYYIYHPKLEIGNKDTHWTAAPEDVDEQIIESANNVHQSITENNDTIVENYNKAIADAVQNYISTGDFEAFQDAVKEAEDEMKQSIENNHKEAMDGIGKVDEKLKTYFDFTDDGLIIKLNENSIQLLLANDMIAFYKGAYNPNDPEENRFGWWDGNNFYTGNIYVEVNNQARFGNFAFVPRSDGSLSFLKVGG